MSSTLETIAETSLPAEVLQPESSHRYRHVAAFAAVVLGVGALSACAESHHGQDSVNLVAATAHPEAHNHATASATSTATEAHKHTRKDKDHDGDADDKKRADQHVAQQKSATTPHPSSSKTNQGNGPKGSNGAGGAARIKCGEPVGQGTFDPIVYHNEANPPAHMHTFFGNKALLALANPNTASYTDLEGKTTACENKGDTAGYWIPTLMDKTTGKAVPIRTFNAYYRSFDHHDTGPAEPFAPDTRLVAGNPMARKAQDTKIVSWSCGQFSDSGAQSFIPDCSGQKGGPGNSLTLHVTFPTCWDGKLNKHANTGNVSDNNHFAYRQGENCPTGFPHKMVELRETIGFDYTGPAETLMLASDAMEMSSSMGTEVRPGQTAHADFINAWNQAKFKKFVEGCIVNRSTHDDCHQGGLAVTSAQ